MKDEELKPEIVRAVVKKLGGIEGIQRFLCDELEVRPVRLRRCLRVANDIIRLTVISDGTTGPEWIERLGCKGFYVTEWTKKILRSPDFKPTIGVVYNIIILKGRLYTDSTTAKIRVKAGKLGYLTPNTEVACLIRESLSDKKMKALCVSRIVPMHEPIVFSDDKSAGLLCVARGGRGEPDRMLYTVLGNPNHSWSRGFGFAFVISQADAQN